MLVTKRLILSAILGIAALLALAANPKHEFRGAWLHTIFQSQYKELGTEECKKYLVRQLDSLQAMGLNAILFQVRPQSDAFYKSNYEPWSRFLTEGGKAPVPYWDPLEFMIEESHRRGMELHAWLNPYRVTSSAKQTLPKGHIYHKHPERFVRYDGKLYFNPGLPENREYIAKVVEDIVSRYDVDAIHFDDYFYPYPVKGKVFDDAKAYAKYGKGKDLGDWRRQNVDMLIEDLNKRIKALKPWVRFGISPFGIWRNKSSDPRGSDTNGLQNYDALYADVLLWEEKGWIDYQLPQLYWDLEHPAASSRVLLDWWNRNSGSKRHLYIGQDVSRTMKKGELGQKVQLSRNASNVSGNCWWPGYALTKNDGGVADSLATVYQNTKALVPPSTWLWDKRPDAPRNLVLEPSGTLAWQAPVPTGTCADAVRFVVYRFEPGAEIDTDEATAIVAVVPGLSFAPQAKGVYVVTALDRVNNESLPSIAVTVE